jgi:methylenetetrahydrofolate dehydrogenase (NADP+)/methenyltetrahydrofolate cyclohydrolase
MAAILMDGNALRDEIIAGLRVTVEAAGSPPICLATVLVGNDGPSQRYVASKHKKALEAGLVARHVDLPDTATQGEVEAAVRELTEDVSVHGELVQLPLPDGLDPEPVLDLIPPEKDVDGLTERSMGRLLRNRPGLVGCTPNGVIRLLEKYEVPTSGARAVVIGRSTLVGLPLSLLLNRKGADATVTMAHSRTADIKAVVREADIVIGAAGQAGMITGDMIKPGADPYAWRYRADDDRLPNGKYANRRATAVRVPRLTTPSHSAGRCVQGVISALQYLFMESMFSTNFVLVVLIR